MSMKIAKISVSVATPISGLITKKRPNRMPSTDKAPMPQPPPESNDKARSALKQGQEPHEDDQPRRGHGVPHRGLLSIAKPAIRDRIPPASFGPQLEASEKLPTKRKMPANQQVDAQQPH